MTALRKPVFDAWRAAAGRMDPDMVPEIDALLTKHGVPVDGGDEWLALALPVIKSFEGCHLRAYPDPGTGGKPWTIGWGSTTDEKGNSITPGTGWTQARADERLATQVRQFAAEVDRLLLGYPVTPAQKAALVSFAYNVGTSALSGSTLLKKHKAADYDGAAAQFLLWNKAAGKALSGLTKRRQAEARLYKGLAA